MWWLLVVGGLVGRDAQIATVTEARDWTALESLVDLMASPDRPIAASAARAAARIAIQLDAEAAEQADVPPDQIALVADACAAVARRREIWPDVRVDALTCAHALGGATIDIVDRPDDPEVRRAAAELSASASPDDATRTVLARVAADDPDPVVAAAAAAALCSDDDPARALAALSPAGRARLAKLLEAPPLEPGAMRPIRDCLARRR